MAVFKPIVGTTRVNSTLSTKVLDALRARLKQDNGSYVTVGIHQDAGTYEDIDGRDTPVAAVALWMEYGTKTVPARPFLYSTMSDKEVAIKRLLARAQAAVFAGKQSLIQSLSAVGMEVQVFVQNAIKSNVGPDLSPAYAAARLRRFKESGSRTLIRSGLLLRSVGWKVWVGGKVVAQPGVGGEQVTHPDDSRASKKARKQARKQALADKSAREEQRELGKLDPDGTTRRFREQFRVRPERLPPKKGG